MYRCQVCGTNVPPKTPRQAITTMKPVVYPIRRGVIRKRVFDKGKWLWKRFDDPGGEGIQISKEVTCCPACKQKADKQQLVQT